MSAGAARAEIDALISAERAAASERADARVLIEGSEQRGYRARIEVGRGQSRGERELLGPRCDEVAEAAVLIVAMAIDPEGAATHAAEKARSTAAAGSGAEPARDAAAQPGSVTAELRSAAPQPSEPRPGSDRAAGERDESEPPATESDDARDAEGRSELEAEPAPEQAEQLEVSEPSDPRTAARFALGVHGVGDAGSLPNATIGGGLLAGVHWANARLELQATVYLPQLEVEGPQPDSTEISLQTGALAGCVDVLGARDRARSLGVCATLEAGVSRGAPRRVSNGVASSGVWLASLFGLEARQQLLGPLHLRVRAEAGLPVLRPSYEIEPFGRVFRASPVLGRFGFSAFVLFP